eukprot:6941046-Alexandrium_andersonii.AAC.1
MFADSEPQKGLIGPFGEWGPRPPRSGFVARQLTLIKGPASALTSADSRADGEKSRSGCLEG